MTYNFETDCAVVMVAKMKGGSGVSTTAMLTAFSYAQENPTKRVALICADNTTYTISSFMARARVQHPSVKPPVITYQWKERHGLLVDSTIEFCTEKEIDVAFIDMAPDKQLFEQSITLADLVVAPSQCKLADAERALAVYDTAAEHDVPVIVSLNRMSKARQGQAREWREWFTEEKIFVSAHEAIMHNEYSKIWGKAYAKTKTDRDGNAVLDAEGKPVKIKDVKVEYPVHFGAYKGLGREIAVVIN